MRLAPLLPLLAWQPLPSALRCQSTRLSSAPVASSTAWVDLTDEAQRLTDAQTARTVAAVCSEGVLCTQLSADAGGEGAAFTSYAPFVVDDNGCLLTPVPSAEVQANLAASGGAASFHMRAARGGAASGSAVTLIGVAEEHPTDEVLDDQLMRLSKVTGDSVEELAARPWRRIVPARVHLADGVRGVEAWLPASEYAEAEANPLAAATTTLLAKINGQHGPALRRFAAIYAGVQPVSEVEEAELLCVDQLGFDLHVKLGAMAPPTLMRVGFRMPPTNEEEGTSLFMKLFQEAFEREHGSL